MLSDLKLKVAESNDTMDAMKLTVAESNVAMEKKVGRLEAKMAGLETKVDGLDTKMDQVLHQLRVLLVVNHSVNLETGPRDR